MIAYFGDMTDAVSFADDLNQTFGPGSASITTISQERYAVSYVPRATVSLLDDIEQERAAKFFSKTQPNT